MPNFATFAFFHLYCFFFGGGDHYVSQVYVIPFWYLYVLHYDVNTVLALVRDIGTRVSIFLWYHCCKKRAN